MASSLEALSTGASPALKGGIPEGGVGWGSRTEKIPQCYQMMLVATPAQSPHMCCSSSLERFLPMSCLAGPSERPSLIANRLKEDLPLLAFSQSVMILFNCFLVYYLCPKLRTGAPSLLFASSPPRPSQSPKISRCSTTVCEMSEVWVITTVAAIH